MRLSIINLSKKFDKKSIFENFSCSFDDKGIYALSGESGIGKTTLLRIIAGLDKDYRGKVEGGGIGKVSYAFQEYRLFPELNALENVFFANSDRKTEAEAKKMLIRLGFNETDLLLMPNELSGGMKQRVSLARAFLKDSPILLLDEPTKELDPVNIDAVLELIKENAAQRLVIIVSHNEDDLIELNAQIINIKKL